MAVTKFVHPRQKNLYKISRIVVLPEWQGVGVAIKFMEAIGDIYASKGFSFSITTSLKALCLTLQKSASWKCYRFGRVSSGSGKIHNKQVKGSTSHDRLTGSFAYIRR